MLHTTGFLSADENDLEQPVMVRNKNLSDDIDIFLSWFTIPKDRLETANHNHTGVVVKASKVLQVVGLQQVFFMR